MKNLAILSLVFSLLSAPLWAEQGTLEYSIHADQFHVLDSRFQLDLRDGRYLLEGDANTTGLAGFFFPYRVRFWSAGMFDADGVSPGSFGNDGSNSRRRRQVEMVYDERGPTVVALQPVPGEDDERDPVPAGMRNGTIDPFSALLLAARRATADGRCPTLPERIFDGRRLFSLHLDTSDKPLPEGLELALQPTELLACELRAEQLAGHWKGERGRWSAGPFQRREEREEVPTVVWFGRVDESLPLLPVAVERAGSWRIRVALERFDQTETP